MTRADLTRALRQLGDGWTVLERPRFGLERPDYLAVHRRFGVCVIAAGRWTDGDHRVTADGLVQRVDADGRWMPVAHPRAVAARQRQMMFDRVMAAPGDPTEPTDDVRAVVVELGCSTQRARELLCRTGGHAEEHRIDVRGVDVLDDGFEAILQDDAVAPPTEEALRRVLSVAAWRGADGRAGGPVRLTAGQQRIAQQPAGARLRRARGPAGSGKSVALGARAARLAAEGCEVLVLSFNVSAANHLRGLVNDQCAITGADPTLVTCANFHSFCEHVVESARAAGIETATVPGMRPPDSIVACAKHVLETGFELCYDAVLVDEGHDVLPAWWELLHRQVVIDGGEMLLVADPLQDLHNRRAWLAEESMRAAGFAEPWIELSGSERMPADLMIVANEFAHRNVFGDQLPTDVFAWEAADPGPAAGPAGRTVGRWQNIPTPQDMGRATGRAVLQLLAEHPELEPRDVVFLCEHHHDGEDAAAEIEAAGLPVQHVFSRDPDDPRRHRRYRLWPEADAITGCTVHSFEGRGARAVVFGIGIETRTKRDAYVSLTRVAADPDGGASFLTVVNADRRVDEFESVFRTVLIAPGPPHPARPIGWAPPRPELRIG